LLRIVTTQLCRARLIIITIMIFFAPAVKIQGLKTKVKNKRLEWLEVNVVAGKETVAKKYRVKPLDGDCDALK